MSCLAISRTILSEPFVFVKTSLLGMHFSRPDWC